MIKTYHLYQGDGCIQLSESFTVREFACKDGSDTIMIDETLVAYLQRIRNWAGAPVIINSGYRTPAYNATIRGAAKNSKHTKGMAADIKVRDHIKSIEEIAKYAEAIGLKGIECNKDLSYVHIDTRTDKWHRYFIGGKYKPASFGGSCPYAEPTKSLRRGCSGDGVRWLQFWLRLWGYDIAVDGSFGEKTAAAVSDVQKRRGLTVDGIAGEKTKAALKGY